MTALRHSNWRFLAAQVVAFAAGLLLTIPTEIMKFRAAAQTKAGVLAWIFWLDHDTTFPLMLLVLAPALWFVHRLPFGIGSDEVGRPSVPRRSGHRAPGSGKRAAAISNSESSGGSIDGRAWTMAVACALTAIVASAWIASLDVLVEEGKPSMHFGDLPPDIHDEFSYLFQAKTFLAGRLSFPSSPRMPELFDQMHVVNEGRFASRYFPGVGLWLAPFVALGHPYWAEWLASGLTAFFVFWAGRELAGNRVGLAAGLLTALSPGMGLFSNLLLSHGPTMAALSLFLFVFLRFMRTARPGDAFWAGCGLSFAMLCRPMTAAGFALPFGVWLAWWLASPLVGGRRKRPTEVAGAPVPAGPRAPFASPVVEPAGSNLSVPPIRRWRAAAALAIPLAIGLGLLFVYDYAVTGNGFLSPYSLYTNTCTPRHVYGFNNVVRGERKLGPKVLDNYDRWAENLTPRLAAENVQKRAAASAKWTLGPVPLALAIIVFLLAALWQVDWRWRLVAGSVFSLNAVHVPYWLAGIMDWHYVFETGPPLAADFRGYFSTTGQLLETVEANLDAGVVGRAGGVGRRHELAAV